MFQLKKSFNKPGFSNFLKTSLWQPKKSIKVSGVFILII